MEPRKLIVGYDLCEDFTQISCYSYKSQEPITIGVHQEEENTPIPTALCVKNDTRQWLYGDEAITCAAEGAGILVDHLLTKLQTQEVVEIFDQKFSAVELLEKFLKKSLILVKNYFPAVIITKIVIAVPRTSPILVKGIYEALALLGIEKDRAAIISHAGAYLSYALSQEKALWMNDVGLFDFSEDGLQYNQISINRRTKPMIAGLTRAEYTQDLDYEHLKSGNNNAVYAFEQIANTTLYKQIISTLYFTGKGFEGGWADEVIRRLCTNRRVFMGQNLYTKGACYVAKELSDDKKSEEILLLNDDMLTGSLGIRVYCDAKYQEVFLTEAGENWYEINKSIEVIPEGETELEIVIHNIMTRDTIRERFPLDQLPKRPNRMTRLEIVLSFRDRATAVITVNDLGFGELYPGTGYAMEFIIKI